MAKILDPVERLASLHRIVKRSEVTPRSPARTQEEPLGVNDPWRLPSELHPVTDKAPCPSLQPHCRDSLGLCPVDSLIGPTPSLRALLRFHYQIVLPITHGTTSVCRCFFTTLNIGCHFAQSPRDATCRLGPRVIAASTPSLIGFHLPRYRYKPE